MIERSAVKRLSVGLALAVLLVTTTVDPAGAQLAESSPDRWQDIAYGVSLVPPPGTVQYEGPSIVWDDPRGFSISFEIVYSEVPSNVESFAASAVVQASFSRNDPRLVTEDGEIATSRLAIEKIAERPATRLYFTIDPDQDDHETMIQGQAIIMLEPYAAAVVKFNSPQSLSEPAREAFDAVLQSLHIPLGQELNTFREQLVSASDDWLKQIGPAGLQASLPELQWYRLTFGDKDIGHLRFASTQDPAALKRAGHTPPGTLVKINQRRMINGQPLDSQTTIFVAADGGQEEWSTKTTLRDREHSRAGLRGNASSGQATWAETGVRGDRTINGREVHALTVIVDTPAQNESVVMVEKNKQLVPQRRTKDARSGTNVNEWQAPKRAYLSQADLWTFAGLLPQKPGEYCFTAYHPRTGKPGLRMVQVLPRDGGGVIVRDRPNSKLSPIEHVYDGDGNLIRRTHPDGLSLLPTTPQELSQIWNIKID